MILLALDTSTPHLLLGLLQENKMKSQVIKTLPTHGEVIFHHVVEFLCANEVSLNQLNTVIVSGGPGSFTGTRVGWASALGLAEGLGIGCVSVSGLDALGYLDRHSRQLGWAIFDARRGRYYAGLFQEGMRLGEFRDAPLEDLVAQCPRFYGPNLPVDWHKIGSGILIDDWTEGLLALGQEKFIKKQFIQPGEGPIYLRPSV